MKKFLLLIAAVMISSAASAQYYDWAIGVRGGLNASSLTVKHVFNNGNAAEALVGWSYSKLGSGFNLTGLYEFNVPIIGNGFNLYYGAGAHLGGWTYKEGSSENKNNGFNLGLDAIVGLEYSLKVAPLAFSIDFKPRIDFLPSAEFQYSNVALGIKYTF
ncbi:MAG: hypothetical protein IKT94_01540 [Rikenellaceae bacterium]|nr:hypothetical protein [Rikenellaceae bacterium]